MKLLGWLLHVANARPPWNKEAFYAVKDRILKRWGTPDGYDVQYIRKDCWGYEEDDGCKGPKCRRCYGSGVYSEKKVHLLRWKLGGYSFHTIGNLPVYDKTPTINGLVKHQDYGMKSQEAALWLFLLFDRRTFWRQMRGCKQYRWQWWPLLFIQRNIGWPLGRLWDRVRQRECYCGRHFRAWFSSAGWCSCRRCRRRVATVLEADIPF